MSLVVRLRCTASVATMCVAVAACSGGGEKGSGPNPPPPSGSAIPALDDAADRLLPGLPVACSVATSAALNALRGKISPTRTATSADIAAARTALGRCTDAESSADRDAIHLALDVVAEALAAR